MVVSEGALSNITGGMEGATGVRLNTHKHKLKHRFDIMRKLGQGTYGKVQLAVNKETGQEVAIKTIKKAKIETDQDLIRIRREIQIMSSVQHPSIIHIYEVFENREKIILVMEYAAGGELYDYLSERKVLPEEEARRIFRQIAAACYYCHKHKICHRDLKLENILLDEKGNAKIADFGLSNVYDGKHLLTTFCGSPLYASPEIVKGIPYYGPEVDCWSLGVLLYTLVYGAMPFDGSNFKRLVKQITNGEYYEPKKPSDASELIRSMLTVAPKRRADIEDICSHWWVNEGYSVSCLEVADELACQTPVRLDLLLSLAPCPTSTEKLVIDDQDEVSASLSLGNTSAEAPSTSVTQQHQSAADRDPMNEYLNSADMFARNHSSGSLMEVDQSVSTQAPKPPIHEDVDIPEVPSSGKRKLKDTSIADVRPSKQVEALPSEPASGEQEQVSLSSEDARRILKDVSEKAKKLPETPTKKAVRPFLRSRLKKESKSVPNLSSMVDYDEEGDEEDVPLESSKTKVSPAHSKQEQHSQPQEKAAVPCDNLPQSPSKDVSPHIVDQSVVTELEIDPQVHSECAKPSNNKGSDSVEESIPLVPETQDASKSECKHPAVQPSGKDMKPHDIKMETNLTETENTCKIDASSLPEQSEETTVITPSVDTSAKLQPISPTEIQPSSPGVDTPKKIVKKKSPADKTKKSDSSTTKVKTTKVGSKKEGASTKTGPQSSRQVPEESSKSESSSQPRYSRQNSRNILEAVKMFDGGVAKPGEGKSQTLERPKKVLIPGVKISDARKQFELKNGGNGSGEKPPSVIPSRTVSDAKKKFEDNGVTRSQSQAPKSERPTSVTKSGETSPPTKIPTLKSSESPKRRDSLKSDSDESSGSSGKNGVQRRPSARRSTAVRVPSKSSVDQRGKSVTSRKEFETAKGKESKGLPTEGEPESGIKEPTPSPEEEKIACGVADVKVEKVTEEIGVMVEALKSQDENVKSPQAPEKEETIPSATEKTAEEEKTQLKEEREEIKREEKLARKSVEREETKKEEKSLKPPEKGKGRRKSPSKTPPRLYIPKPHQAKKESPPPVLEQGMKSVMLEIQPNVTKEALLMVQSPPNTPKSTPSSSQSTTPKADIISPALTESPKRPSSLHSLKSPPPIPIPDHGEPTSADIAGTETSFLRKISEPKGEVISKRRSFYEEDATTPTNITEYQAAFGANNKQFSTPSAQGQPRRISHAEFELSNAENKDGHVPHKYTAQRSEVAFPVQAPEMPKRATSVEPSMETGRPRPAKAIQRKTSERVIPILMEETQEQMKPQPLPLERSNSRQSESSSQASSENGLHTPPGLRPLRQSAREYIIPIALEGGGYATPTSTPGPATNEAPEWPKPWSKTRPSPLRTKRSSLLNDIGGRTDEEGHPIPSGLQRLSSFGKHQPTEENNERPLPGAPPRTTMRMPPSERVEKSDSFSSAGEDDDDDDGFDILTAESLFSALLSRVRSLTRRINKEEAFPTRRFSSHFGVPFHPRDFPDHPITTTFHPYSHQNSDAPRCGSEGSFGGEKREEPESPWRRKDSPTWQSSITTQMRGDSPNVIFQRQSSSSSEGGGGVWRTSDTFPRRRVGGGSSDTDSVYSEPTSYRDMNKWIPRNTKPEAESPVYTPSMTRRMFYTSRTPVSTSDLHSIGEGHCSTPTPRRQSRYARSCTSEIPDAESRMKARNEIISRLTRVTATPTASSMSSDANFKPFNVTVTRLLRRPRSVIGAVESSDDRSSLLSTNPPHPPSLGEAEGRDGGHRISSWISSSSQFPSYRSSLTRMIHLGDRSGKKSESDGLNAKKEDHTYENIWEMSSAPKGKGSTKSLTSPRSDHMETLKSPEGGEANQENGSSHIPRWISGLRRPVSMIESSDTGVTRELTPGLQNGEAENSEATTPSDSMDSVSIASDIDLDLEEESVSERIRRKSYYSRFNDSYPRRRSLTRNGARPESWMYSLPHRSLSSRSHVLRPPLDIDRFSRDPGWCSGATSPSRSSLTNGFGGDHHEGDLDDSLHISLNQSIEDYSSGIGSFHSSSATDANKSKSNRTRGGGAVGEEEWLKGQKKSSLPPRGKRDQPLSPLPDTRSTYLGLL